MKDVERAAKAILEDKAVIYPTETAYGIGVNATSEEAVELFYELKHRDVGKPTHIAVADISMANEYAVVDERARKLAEAFLPGPLTLILPSRGVLPDTLEENSDGTCGIRIPGHAVAQELLKRVGVPLTAASANMSGDKTPYSMSDVRESFGEHFETLGGIIDVGTLPKVQPSTLVLLTGDEPVILREGPITLPQIIAVLD